jgi:hypothetical protein
MRSVCRFGDARDRFQRLHRPLVDSKPLLGWRKRPPAGFDAHARHAGTYIESDVYSCLAKLVLGCERIRRRHGYRVGFELRAIRAILALRHGLCTGDHLSCYIREHGMSAVKIGAIALFTSRLKPTSPPAQKHACTSTPSTAASLPP